MGHTKLSDVLRVVWLLSSMIGAGTYLETSRRELKEQKRSWKNAVRAPSHVIRLHVSRSCDTKLDLSWRQRSHANWLKRGDRNTKFFHAFASERRKRNFLKKLRRDDGVWVEGDVRFKEMIPSYFFSSLFTSSTGDAMNEVL